MTDSDLRKYEVRARSTPVFGRVLLGCRNHHFVADGPVQNGCPGEAVTPAEFFLSGVAACGVELLQVIARQQSLGLSGVEVEIEGAMDRSKPVRPDVALFNSVRVKFLLRGVTGEEGGRLIDAFKGR